MIMADKVARTDYFALDMVKRFILQAGKADIDG